MNISNIDLDKAKRWQADAKIKLDSNLSFEGFISSWITFNYFYSSFCTDNDITYQTWLKDNSRKNGDKSKLLFLVADNQFQTIYLDFKNSHSYLFDTAIDLPIIDMENRKYVPNNRNGRFKFNDLTIQEAFSILYQIRNNLIHGSKDPEKNGRDFFLSHIAGNFLIPFLKILIDKTSN